MPTSKEQRNEPEEQADSLPDEAIENVSGGGQDGSDLLIVNNGDGSDFLESNSGSDYKYVPVRRTQ